MTLGLALPPQLLVSCVCLQRSAVRPASNAGRRSSVNSGGRRPSAAASAQTGGTAWGCSALPLACALRQASSRHSRGFSRPAVCGATPCAACCRQKTTDPGGSSSFVIDNGSPDTGLTFPASQPASIAASSPGMPVVLCDLHPLGSRKRWLPLMIFSPPSPSALKPLGSAITSNLSKSTHQSQATADCS